MKTVKNLLFIIFCLASQSTFAQFDPPTANQNTLASRAAQTGIGFTNVNDFIAGIGSAVPTRFVVTDGVMGHLETGVFGDFSNGNTWSGLGMGGGPGAYGFVTIDNSKIGALNLLDNELLLAWGDVADKNQQYFKLNSIGSFSEPNKTVMFANPRGAIGVNAEPISAIYVDTRNSLLVPADENDFGGVPGPGLNKIFKSITIENDQRVEDAVNPTGIQESASSMGKQGNSSLIETSVVVEGFRGQIPSFSSGLPTDGVAINAQVVKDPIGIPNFPASFVSATANSLFNPEYAELSWQDFNYQDNVTDDCNVTTLAQKKLFFSFRNGQPGTGINNSFSTDNKKVVATMTGTGRFGVNTTSPICNIGSTDIFLTVAGNAFLSGQLFQSSDRRFKRNIQPIENAMDKIRAMEGTSYEMKTDEFPDMHFGEGPQFGFIAQDLEEILPEVTGQNEAGYYSVNYSMIIPVLTQALKEQDAAMIEMQVADR